MEKKVQRFVHAYLWYNGFILDLLFYRVIESLFLTVVKNFSEMQIVSLTFVSTVIYIVFQFPFLWLIQRIGNTASLRLRALFVLLSSILITFGSSYFMVALGSAFYNISFILRSSATVALENNLDMIGKREQFISTRTGANMVYSLITLLISFFASWMFNVNHYLPMVGCIVTAAAGFVLSLFMKDYSAYNKIACKKSKEKIKIRYTPIIVLTVAVYGVCYSTVSIGQSDGMLFLQQNILKAYDVEKTALIIGVVVCLSRIIRVLSNVIFARVYKQYKFKAGIAATLVLLVSIGSMLLGSLISHVVTKIVVMSTGYIMLLFVRDPLQLFVEDVVIENSPKEEHNSILMLMSFAFKSISALMSLCFMLMLLKVSLIGEIIVLTVAALIGVVLCVKLHNKIYKNALCNK